MTPPRLLPLLLLSIPPVVSANLAVDVAKCSIDANNITRLACYDNLAPEAAKQNPARTSATVSKWRVQTQTSKIDDSNNVFLVLQAESEIQGWPSKHFTPSLTIRCRERRTEMYIAIGMAADVEYVVDTATVTFRIDKQPAFKVAANKSTDGVALFIPQATSLAKRLFPGETLLFQFIPFNSSGQMTTFDIRGLSEAIKPIREACKW